MRRHPDLKVDLETVKSNVVSSVNGKAVAANQSRRPANYFADDYGVDEQRVALESAMSKVTQRPER
jgi:hypothetical protein